MESLFIFVIIFFFLFGAYLWVKDIDYMKENHPDYRGEDLFNEDEKKEKT